MLDDRIQTFLVLCETRSYTKTAQELHITQPAVTQHIQYLERKYGAPLVEYANRDLQLTPKGEALKEFALAMRANNRKIEQEMLKQGTRYDLNFGSTLTIGEYVMPEKIGDYLIRHPKANVSMLVENTKILLKKLDEGRIDFAVVEGYFDKERYGWRCIGQFPFVGVCSPKDSLAQGKVTFEQLLDHRLIIREKDSGTRTILETLLQEHNRSIFSFQNQIEIGNFNVIKKLVKEQLGITFVYKKVVEQELQSGTLKELEIEQFHLKREFNIVYLKEDIFSPGYEEFWNILDEKNEKSNKI